MSGYRDDWYVRLPHTTARVIDLPGEPQELVEITVRLGAASLERLTNGRLNVRELWLTEQPDGTYAIGVTTAVETDDREAQS